MKRIFITIVLILFSHPAFASGKLDSSLTPLGAEQAGNASGIPSWDGGIKTPPASYHQGGFHPDPFADDKPLMVITSDNWTQYKNQLSVGYQAMFQNHKEFRMPIYPTRRSASFPDAVYTAIRQNAQEAQMVHNGNGIQGGSMAVPFPVPSNGLEAIWNHLLRYQGTSFDRLNESAVVTSPDHIIVSRIREDSLFPCSFPGIKFDSPTNVAVYLKQNIVYPPRSAGTIILVEETVDKVKELRQSWIYNPGQRRVSRAPFISYDTTPPSSEGLRTYDQYDLFNGATDRYDWTLVGKQAMYVPYNAYRLADHKITEKEVIGPYFLNPDYTRYELHRVWKVDAVLKRGQHHIYAHRVFYLDEDSWNILVSEEYDGRGNLWRFGEAHVINYYEVPLIMLAAETHYDLRSNQYLVMKLQVEPLNFSVHLSPDDFTPSELRREGNR